MKPMRQAGFWAGVVLMAGMTAGAARADEVTAAGLTWEQTRLSVQLPVGAQQADGVFLFRNASRQPVTITQIVPGCSCTTGELEKKRYEPGEAGKLPVQFKAAGRSGRQQNWLNVTTDASKDPVRLEFVVQVPEPMSVLPRLVLWSGETEPAVTKEIRVEFKEAGEVRALDATGAGESFTVKVEPTKEPAVWRVLITPLAGVKAPARATVELTARTERAGELKSRVYVQVR